MADDSGELLVQLAANSNSAHSLPQKLAKLEARMVGISQAGAGPLHAPFARAKQSKLSDAEEAPSASSEADKDEIEFAVQLNGRKRKRSTQSSTGHEEAQYALLKVNLEETREAMKEELEKVSMQARGLEAVVQKLQQEAAAYTATIEKLQNEQKELKQLELVREQKKISVLSELLIAVASAERQEAKARLQADALRLGTIGIRRVGTIISEVWEDGQALSDIQARLRAVLEQKDALDRRRKLLKKKLTVDVWSAGIILYQMLFGRRPFGHEQSQERILREETILNARRVDFPARPDFIKRCFTYHQKDRPDVLTVMQDPYLSYIKKK
eukprot:SM000108S14193  [mRNA]  locus=s108:181370:184506:+ [translate_table: standard]